MGCSRFTIRSTKAVAKRLAAGMALGLALLCSGAAGAYTVQGGDVLVRGVAGVSVNVLRLDVVTRATPPGGLLVGVDVDYSLDGPWNLTGTFRPVGAPGFVDLDVGAGIKYRVVQLEAPFIPYAAVLAKAALGAPLRLGPLHANFGGRVAAGVDYFVMRDLAVGLEAAVDVSLLALPILAAEASTEVLVGLSYRF